MTYPALLAGAFALTLRRFGAGNDVCFGLTSSGRPGEVADLDAAVGAFVTTLPARARIDPDQPVREMLTTFATGLDQRRAHEFADLRQIVAQSDLRTGRELFEAIFVYEGLPPKGDTSGPVRLAGVDILAASDEPLTLAYHPGEAPTLDLYFDPTRFDGDVVRALGEDFLSLLTAITANPNAPVHTLSAALRPETAPRTLPSPALLPDLILSAAARTPQATAIHDCDGTAITYAELDRRSATIAAALAADGVRPGDIVALALPRSGAAIVAMLATLRAGAAYVALDLDYPAARNEQILKAVGAKCILTSGPVPALNLPAPALDISDLPTAEAPKVQPNPDDLAYVLFTSGSEGRPKGVEITHANLAASQAGRAGVYGTDPSGFLVVSSLAFDSSVVGIYWALSTGGTLVLSPPNATQDPRGLARLIQTAGVDHLLCLPDLYATMLDAALPEQLAPLHTVILAGEALPEALVARHRATLGQTRLFNEYGPTETTVWCAAYDATDHSGGPVPIGQTPQGTHIRVADPDGAPLPSGAPGELRVSGPTVFRGYQNDPAKTRAALPTGPSGTFYRTGDLGLRDGAGQLHYQGRLDDQVKIRGFRVELGEVEAALTAQPSVAEAVVIADAGRLLAYVTTNADSAPDTIKSALATRLPGYMQPARLEVVAQWPRLPNGKIDRKALLATNSTTPTAEPLTEHSFVARELAQLWRDLLGLDHVAPHDDFFDVGGDSLRTVHLMLAAEKVGLNIAAHEVFECPTFEQMVARIEAKAGAEQGPPDAELMTLIRPEALGHHVTMIHGSAQMCSYMATALGDNRTLAFQYSAFQRGMVPEANVNQMARNVIDRIRRTRPAGPYHLCGYSIGAVVAVEAARILTEEMGEDVPLLFLLDPSWETGFKLKPPGPSGSRVKRFSKQMGAKLRTRVVSARKAKFGKRNRQRPEDNLIRMSYVAQVYRKILLGHTPRPYGGRVVALLSRQGEGFSKWNDWLAAVCPNTERETLSHDHLDLQVEKDALFAWTTRLVQMLQKSDS